MEVKLCMLWCIFIIKIFCIESILFLILSLKLCNFYLDENDNVKLGDFGFACQLAS